VTGEVLEKDGWYVLIIEVIVYNFLNEPPGILGMENTSEPNFGAVVLESFLLGEPDRLSGLLHFEEDEVVSWVTAVNLVAEVGSREKVGEHRRVEAGWVSLDID